jgi:hypothetical protein
MQKWFRGFAYALALCVLSPIVASDAQTRTKFRAAYVPLNTHACNTVQGRKDLNLPPDIGLHIDRICRLSGIPQLAASVDVEIVFIMCNDAAQRLLHQPGFPDFGPLRT